MDIDYLIIGQGLAGSLLAWELINRNQRVLVIDNAVENASLIAAGLINPVTGMRLVKTSQVDRLLPTALNYYQQLSQYFQQSFYIEKPMIRLLRTKKELFTAQKRLLQSEYQPYFDKITSTSSGLNAANGILKQQKTGYLLTQPLLQSLKKFFIESNSYLHSEINHNKIILSPHLFWKNIKPKHIIFCEGYHAINNPWFSWLPFQPVKGEIITAIANKPIINQLLNYGHWFVPLDSNQFRTGASFDRNNLNTQPTSIAKKKLLDSLYQFYSILKIDQIIQHQAGIRPTTLDKNPFIGSHPHYPALHIFNGFGAKGSLMIPAYCQALADNLLHNQPLPASSSIKRYHHLLTHQQTTK